MAELPSHVAARGQASLYRLGDGRFQIIRDGALASILTGPGYFLATDAVLSVLRELGVPAMERAVVVVDPTKATEIVDYRELQVAAEVTPETVDRQPAGQHLWHHANQDLFVSPELRRRLELRCSDLVFSEGFTEFA
jgi:hypothetical protein